ncbi:MAG: YfhO family protein [Lachnospiraceae bacterium]|nr:YfhO family protein [Lachnospiraceae bacterium]
MNRKGRGKLGYFALYTVCFALLSLFLLLLFGQAGRIPMKASDGFPQDYNAFLYWGNYIRTFFRELFVNHRWQLPLFDPTIGYGADALLTLHYHVVGDPFYLILGLIPQNLLDTGFGLIALFRMYLSGVTFSFYALHHRNGRAAVLPGALLYALSGYQLRVGFTNNMFAMPTIYFPLVLLGIDLIFEKKRPYLFIIATALSALSNFYFFYMIVAFAALYCIFRYVRLIKRFTVKDIGAWVGKFLFYGFDAVLIACAVFLPVVLHLVLYMNRFGVERYSTFLYPLRYYKLILPTFMTMEAYPSLYTYIGMTGIGVLAVLTVFSCRKKYKDLKIAFCLFSVFLLIPFFGRALNGFAYMTNRWTWAFTLLVAYMTVKAVQEFGNLSYWQKRFILIGEFLVCGLVLSNLVSRTGQTIMALLLLFAAGSFVFLAGKKEEAESLPIGEDKGQSSGNSNRSGQVAGGCRSLCNFIRRKGLVLGFLFLSMAGIAANMYYRYSPEVSDEVYSYRKYGTVDDSEYENGLRVVRGLPDAMNSRTQLFHMNDAANTAMNNRVMSTGFYYSIYNDDLSQLFRDLEMQTTSYDYRYYHLDGRSMLESLFGIKHTVVNRGEEGFLSDRFRKGGDSQSDLRECEHSQGDPLYAAYENHNPLPLGFSYSKVLNASAYEEMTAVERQQALLQGAFVEGEVSLPEAQPVFAEQEQDYELLPDESIELSDKQIRVLKDDAVLTFRYKGLAGSENYIEWKGMDYRSFPEEDVETTSVQLYVKLQEGADSGEESGSEADGSEPNAADEVGDSGKEIGGQTKEGLPGGDAGDGTQASGQIPEVPVEKDYMYRNYKHLTYCGQHDFIHNAGYSETPCQEISVRFSEAGVYSYDSLKVYCQPTDKVDAYVDELKKESLQDISFEANRITGNIETSDRKLFCLSIPYSAGWSVYVDGERQELLRLNRAFLGVELSAGRHNLEFRYTTPFLKMGMLFSLLGFVILIGIVIWFRKTGKSAHDSQVG